MKPFSLVLLSLASVFTVTVHAQGLSVGGAIGSTGAINLVQPGSLAIGTIIPAGSINISSGGNISLSTGSGITNRVTPSGNATIGSFGGTISLQSPNAIGRVTTGPTVTPISLMSSPPISHASHTVTSPPSGQNPSQGALQASVPRAVPIASAGGLVNGAVTVRMPLVNASTITVR